MQNNLKTMASGSLRERTHQLSAEFLNPVNLKAKGTPLAIEPNELLMPKPGSTYLFRINGHLWADQGLVEGDIAVVDKALDPKANDLIINWHDNGFSICRYWQLQADEEALGVVTAIIHPCSR